MQHQETPVYATGAADIVAGRVVRLKALPSAEDLAKTAQQFDENNPIETYNAIDWLKNRGWFGGKKSADKVLKKYAEDIEIAAEAYRIDPAFLRAIIRMETTYNPDPPFTRSKWFRDTFNRPQSVFPTNVNYSIWEGVLLQHGITSAMMDNPRTNIRAAAIVLKELDQSLEWQAGETIQTRVAQVASLYGHTEKTIDSDNGIIMYGGKAAQLYVNEVGADAASKRIDQPSTMSIVPPSVPLESHSQAPRQAVR